MSEGDLRPPGDTSKSRPPIHAGGPPWWEPLASKLGMLSVVIVLGLGLGLFETLRPAQQAARPKQAETPAPSSTLSFEQQVQDEVKRKLDEYEKQRPAREAQEKRNAEERAQRRQQDKVSKSAALEIDRAKRLADFRAALDNDQPAKAQEMVRRDRANHLAMRGPNYSPVLDAQGRSPTRREGTAAIALSRGARSPDRATAIEAVVTAFDSVDVDNADVIVGIVMCLMQHGKTGAPAVPAPEGSAAK